MATVSLTEIQGLGHFDYTKSSGIASRWERWLRAFELFAARKGVTNPAQKKALLLHTAGMGVQDVYFTLQKVTDDESDVYEKATRALNTHFKPQSNTPCERLTFRETKQLTNESIEQYITRLRHKAQTCDFRANAAVEEQIRDQVISGCHTTFD